LLNPLKLEISLSSLDIIHFGGNKNIGSSLTAKLVTSKGRIEVCRIGDPLFCGLKLNQIHPILSINFGEIRIRSEFSSKASELKGEMKRIVNNS